jgi:hypothetical protein
MVVSRIPLVLVGLYLGLVPRVMYAISRREL